jgi:hypothetical protein
MLVVVAVMKVLVAGVVEMVVASCFGWRSEAFLESFSTCGGNLENLFNPKYRPTASSVQSEIFNDSDVSASTFMIAES